MRHEPVFHKRLALSVAVVVLVGTTLFILENRSVITMITL